MSQFLLWLAKHVYVGDYVRIVMIIVCLHGISVFRRVGMQIVHALSAHNRTEEAKEETKEIEEIEEVPTPVILPTARNSNHRRRKNPDAIPAVELTGEIKRYGSSKPYTGNTADEPVRSKPIAVATLIANGASCPDNLSLAAPRTSLEDDIFGEDPDPNE